MSTGSFLEVKRPGCGADHPTPSSAEITKGYSYTSIHRLGQFKPVMGLLYLLFYFSVNKINSYKTSIQVTDMDNTKSSQLRQSWRLGLGFDISDKLQLQLPRNMEVRL
jgi:hypothetical protein